MLSHPKAAGQSASSTYLIAIQTSHVGTWAFQRIGKAIRFGRDSRLALISTKKQRIVMLKGPIARATIRTSFVLGLRLVVQAGTLLLVARMLGPADYGAFAAIAALAVLMGTFATFGTHLVLLAEISKNPGQRQPVLAYDVPTTLISGSVLFLLYLAAGQFWLASASVPLQVMACIGLAETLLLPLYLLPATEDLALEKTARSQLVVIFPLALRMAVAGIVMLAAPAQPLVLFAWLYLATALLALVTIKVCKPHAWLHPRQWRLPNRAQLKHSVGYATLSLTAAGPKLGR